MPPLGRLKSDNRELETSLGYIMGSCLKGRKKKMGKRRRSKTAHDETACKSGESAFNHTDDRATLRALVTHNRVFYIKLSLPRQAALAEDTKPSIPCSTNTACNTETGAWTYLAMPPTVTTPTKTQQLSFGLSGPCGSTVQEKEGIVV